jgi:hypothetical protein
MKKLSIIAIAASLLFADCTKDLTSLNHNPKASSTAIAPALFLQGQFSLVQAYNTTSVSSAPFRVISQEWVENTYVYESNYNLSYYNSPNGFWNNLYINAIHQLNLAKQSFPVNFLGTPGQLRNDIIIADILEVYGYNLLVNTYGNIPYSQAQNVSIPFPKYDDAKTVFADLLTRLDTCIAGLNTNEPAMGTADRIYGGNVAKWKTFAASLKLRMAMILADTDPTTATKKVNEAIATGVFASKADNALFAYDPGNPANSSPLWNALQYSGRHDFGPSKLLVNTMVGWNDPRTPFYFKLYQGAYSGGVPGFANVFGKYSDLGAPLYVQSLPGDILDYTEVQFSLAEAAARGFISGTPDTYYNSAITASIVFWGGSAGDAATYLAQTGVQYGTGGVTWQQQIGYQEWIASFNNNWDAWTNIRRLGYPNLDAISVPVSPSNAFPVRFYYPPNEKTSNPTNWAAGVAALPGGADVVTAKLFWMK